MNSKNFKTFIFCADVHGDKQDRDAITTFWKFCEMFKADFRVIGGDLWNFGCLRKKADQDERRESLLDDYDAGMAFAEQFKPTHLLCGNHEKRLWDLAATDRGVESDFALKATNDITSTLKKMQCAILPYHARDGVLHIGHLKMVHGYHCGIYAARQHALVYGSCLFGHGHAVDEHSIPGLERRVAREVGCLCQLQMDFEAGKTSSLKHSHGWAFGVIHRVTGVYQVFQAEKVNSHWIIPTDWVVL